MKSTHPLAVRVAEAVAKRKDPKRPGKLFRVTREQHAALIDALHPDDRTAMQSDIAIPNSTQIIPAGPLGQFDGMRLVLVVGESDFPSEVPHVEA